VLICITYAREGDICRAFGRRTPQSTNGHSTTVYSTTNAGHTRAQTCPHPRALACKMHDLNASMHMCARSPNMLINLTSLHFSPSHLQLFAAHEHPPHYALAAPSNLTPCRPLLCTGPSLGLRKTCLQNHARIRALFYIWTMVHPPQFA